VAAATTIKVPLGNEVKEQTVQIGGKPSCSIYVSWLLISLSIAIGLWILDTSSKSGNKLTMLKSSLALWYDFKNCPPPTTIHIIKTQLQSSSSCILEGTISSGIESPLVLRPSIHT